MNSTTRGIALETHQRAVTRPEREGAKVKRWKTTKKIGDPTSEVAHCCIALCRVALCRGDCLVGS